MARAISRTETGRDGGQQLRHLAYENDH